ncbi:MAG: Maf family protein [bacterium]|nr:Maf family protein [bacterium]
MDLYLASTSPRRRELLITAGLRFELVTPGVEHVAGERGTPVELAAARARRKAHGAARPNGGAATVPVLGVDTVVDLDGRELGKAPDAVTARQMLAALAGRAHQVHTGHCLVWPDRGDGSPVAAEVVASSTVTCRQPTTAELDAYLASEAWRGKAGGYGIQDPEQEFLTLAAGAFDTVVGLHVAAVRQLLLGRRA